MIERGRFVVTVPGIDRREYARRSSPLRGLDQEQRRRTVADQVPVRVRQQRAADDAVVMRVLDDEVGCALPHARDDAAVHGRIPAHLRRHREPSAAQLDGMSVEPLPAAGEELLAQHPQAVRFEEAWVGQRRLEVADEQLERGARPIGEPRRLGQCRLRVRGRIEHREYSFESLHVLEVRRAAVGPLI